MSPALFCCSPLINTPSPKPSSLQRRHNPPPPSDKPWLVVVGGAAVKMPTAPWMRGPLLLPPDQVLDFSQKQKQKQKPDEEASSLTAKVRHGRSRHAMRGIIRSIRSLRDADPGGSAAEAAAAAADEGPPEVGKKPPPPPPWAAAEEKALVFGREKKARASTAAERRLPASELARLRTAARGMERRWVKAKKAGVTPEVVEEIFRVWRTSELAAVKIVEPLCRNMDRAREIVEAKTGGFVVCTKRDILVVYRGLSEKALHDIQDNNSMLSTNYNGIGSKLLVGEVVEKENFEVGETLYEREANRLLDGLGPRFIDWWWKKPLPVDADLLPEVVPDFKTPFRQCPPGVRLQLRDDELTYLRMLARPLPTHFALGKNKRLQGLAAAILKLWEKSLIAKIAVKVGIPDTNNEQMACELKRLTGGILILRNKFFIILYRGKDFLPGGVTGSIIKRETVLHDQQLEEEEARSRAAATFHLVDGLLSNTCSIGTFREYQEIQVNHIDRPELCEAKLKKEAEKVRLEKKIKEQEHQLFILNKKIEKSAKVLANLNCSWSSSDRASDQELLTEEERRTFRSIGLKMDEYLLLGRRGIYDGVIGNIHQHWKHREVVKVITMQRGIRQIMYTASLLEIESGGTLIAVEKLRSSRAIIIYRGKNYQRPLKLLPDNLLTKKEALERSIEVQRRGLAVLAGEGSLLLQGCRYRRTHLGIHTQCFKIQTKPYIGDILYLEAFCVNLEASWTSSVPAGIAVHAVQRGQATSLPLFVLSYFQSLKFFARQRERSIWDLKRRLRDLEEEIGEITPDESDDPS